MQCRACCVPDVGHFLLQVQNRCNEAIWDLNAGMTRLNVNMTAATHQALMKHVLQAQTNQSLQHRVLQQAQQQDLQAMRGSLEQLFGSVHSLKEELRSELHAATAGTDRLAWREAKGLLHDLTADVHAIPSGMYDTEDQLSGIHGDVTQVLVYLMQLRNSSSSSSSSSSVSDDVRRRLRTPRLLLDSSDVTVRTHSMELGRSGFARVLAGTWDGHDVAVKELYIGEDDRQASV